MELSTLVSSEKHKIFSDFISEIEMKQSDIQRALGKESQSAMGQFFTPANVAKMMTGMFSQFSESINLLDPGAGVGILSAAFLESAISSPNKPKSIHVSAYELDSKLINHLRNTLLYYQHICQKKFIDMTFSVYNEDFIISSAQILSGENSFFPIIQPKYNYAILNPPYKKIDSKSKLSKILRSQGVDSTNLYTAFLTLVMRLILPEAEMVAIVPRSFCNGTYYKLFRQELLQTMRINRIHIFESRDKAFKEGNVLQENIIFHATKDKNRGSKVVISSNDYPEDQDVIIQEIDYEQLVNPNDREFFIRIVPDGISNNVISQMSAFSTKLKDMGITVSTGRVVDFRNKHLLRNGSDFEKIPLIYPMNFHEGFVKWPLEKSKKPSFMASGIEVNNLLVPSQCYVLVKRFSSKEEKKRIYAAVYDPARIDARRVGFENHLNFFHRRYGGLSLSLVKGLALFLNSSLVDQYFRSFSGHTQVNANDLLNLKYPTEEQLVSLGNKIGDEFPGQDIIDKLITETFFEFSDNGETTMDDPIKAKKRIREALNILKLLNVPKAQQNDRSALTLLSLVNMTIDQKWQNITENLIGITEMMEFFKNNYGINYAPNTRETVRRQTIHQFMQIGLVQANPDDTNRPINSPKTRYLIQRSLLELLRSYDTKDWNDNLAIFLKNTPTLANLQVKERDMPMVPVVLPDGEEILISCGGQNNLIKQIIEDFCPRFTPGGKLIYIGDASLKMNYPAASGRGIGSLK